MMFIASKLLVFAIQPLAWIFAFLLLGLLLMRRRPRTGKSLCWLALLTLVLSGWEFIPNTLMRDLESRYPPPPTDAEMRRYTGVVVLGGAIANTKLWAAHHQVPLNENAERMTTAVALAHKYPHLKLLFTGGIASVPPTGPTEAQLAKVFFEEEGVDPARMLYEGQSRNTYENALYSASVPGVDPHQNWLLLTSAYHMPRAMGVFQKAGWHVRPYPVDYRSASVPSWYDFSFHFGPNSWELALHELLGYYVYKWSGNI